MVTFSQKTFSNVWISIKISLRIQLTIFQHWFRKRLGAGQATSHYLNQWWLVYWRIYTSFGLNELTNADLLLIRPLVSHFGEIWTQINFCFEQGMHLKSLSTKYPPFGSGLNFLQWSSVRSQQLTEQIRLIASRGSAFYSGTNIQSYGQNMVDRTNNSLSNVMKVTIQFLHPH